MSTPVIPTSQSSSSARLRAGDADRDATTAVLQEAVAQGYLTMSEFDQRSSGVLEATTVGELGVFLADLPSDKLVPGGRAVLADRSSTGRQDETVESSNPSRSSSDGGRLGLYAHAGSYLGGVAIMLVIWLVVGLTTGAWYFWPVWPILGWGIGVASHAIPVLTGRGHCHQLAVDPR